LNIFETAEAEDYLNSLNGNEKYLFSKFFLNIFKTKILTNGTKPQKIEPPLTVKKILIQLVEHFEF